MNSSFWYSASTPDVSSTSAVNTYVFLSEDETNETQAPYQSSPSQSYPGSMYRSGSISNLSSISDIRRHSRVCFIYYSQILLLLLLRRMYIIDPSVFVSSRRISSSRSVFLAGIVSCTHAHHSLALPKEGTNTDLHPHTPHLERIKSFDLALLRAGKA